MVLLSAYVMESGNRAILAAFSYVPPVNIKNSGFE